MDDTDYETEWRMAARRPTRKAAEREILPDASFRSGRKGGTWHIEGVELCRNRTLPNGEVIRETNFLNDEGEIPGHLVGAIVKSRAHNQDDEDELDNRTLPDSAINLSDVDVKRIVEMDLRSEPDLGATRSLVIEEAGADVRTSTKAFGLASSSVSHVSHEPLGITSTRLPVRHVRTSPAPNTLSVSNGTRLNTLAASSVCPLPISAQTGSTLGYTITSASSATATAASEWDTSTIVSVVSASIGGALGGAAFVTARQSLDVSKEALETSRGSAAASRSAANTAKDSLALSREVFEYNKAKDALVESQNKKTPPPDDSNDGDLGQCDPGTKTSNVQTTVISQPILSSSASIIKNVPAGVASSGAGLAIHDLRVFPSLSGVSVDFSVSSQPTRGGGGNDDDESFPAGNEIIFSQSRTQSHDTEIVGTTVSPLADIYCPPPPVSDDMETSGPEKSSLRKQCPDGSIKKDSSPESSGVEGNWSSLELYEENGTYYRVWDELAQDLTTTFMKEEYQLLDDATVAALGFGDEVDEIELPDSWWYLLHDRGARQGWVGSWEEDMERFRKKFNTGSYQTTANLAANTSII